MNNTDALVIVNLVLLTLSWQYLDWIADSS